MNKAKKVTKDIALSALAYFRMVVVVGSLIAWSEREWTGLILALLVFYLSTWLINKALDIPSDETIEALVRAIEALGSE